MIKELKDYLHLYLGCECIKDDKTYIFTGISKPYSTVDTTLYNYQLRPKGKGFRSTEYVSNTEIFKPILRPLSNANESERHRLNMFETITAGTDYFGSLKNDAERTVYLLSRGFDIFGLIPAGLAIDKTLHP